MIAVRLALYLTLMAGFGLALFALPRARRAAVPGLRAWLGAAVAAGLVLSLVSLVLLAAQMGGGAVWPVDWDTVGILLAGTALGTAWIVRIAALLAAGLVVALIPRALGFATVCGAVALASLAWAGHGAMDDGAVGWVHLGADIMHLLASGVWVGALLGLILLVARADADTGHVRVSHDALHGFAVTGSIAVGTLIVTGLVNAWLLVGPSAVGALVTTLYGGLLLAKLALFAAMLGLAWFNRFRLTPGLQAAIVSGDTRTAVKALRVSLAVETGCASLILAIVAWIGTLEPPVSLG